MKESQFTTILKQKFLKQHPQAFWYKIPDSFGVDGQKRPFDIFSFSLELGPICIEAKIHNSLSPWRFSKIEPHQIYSLRQISNQGATGYIVLGVRSLTKENDRKIIGRDIARVSLNIWINSNLIPGDQTSINLNRLNIRELVKDIYKKGSKVNEIFMSKNRLEAYSQ